MRLRDLLTRNSASFPWDRPLVVALALEARRFLLLLGIWLGQPKDAFPPFLSRLHLMPAHPDWYLATLVQSLAIGLILVWLLRRLAVGWAVALAAIAGGLAWLGASVTLSSSPFDAYLRVVRPPQEMIDTGLLLGTLAAFRRLVGTVWGMAVASTTAATLCGLARLAMTYSVWGTPWIESWPFDLACEALSGTVFGITLLLLARISGEPAAPAGEQGLRRPLFVGLYVGAHGLATLTLIYLQLGLRFTGWRPTETPALLWLAGVLTACGYVVSLASARSLPGRHLLTRHAAIEVLAVPCALLTLGRWPWGLTALAVVGLILLRVLGTLVVIRAQAADLSARRAEPPRDSSGPDDPAEGLS